MDPFSISSFLKYVTASWFVRAHTGTIRGQNRLLVNVTLMGTAPQVPCISSTPSASPHRAAVSRVRVRIVRSE